MVSQLTSLMLTFRKPRDRLVAAGMADSHGGCAVALLNPNTVLVREDSDGEDEEYCPALNEFQRYLWDLYERSIANVMDIADGDEVVVLHDGDITHGTKYPEGLIPDISPEDQRTIGRWNISPWYAHNNVSTVRLFTGTEAHDWMQGSSEAKIAYKMRKEYPRVDTRARHLGLLKMGQDSIDVSHHGPGGGSREWLRGNVARYYLRDRIWKDRRMGVPPSRLYLRGHFHVRVWETLHLQWEGQNCDHDLFVIPSFSGVNWHTRKVTRSDPELTNGMIAVVYENGKQREIVDLTKSIDLRKQEVLSVI